MNKLFYNIFLQIYPIIIRIIAPFNPKAKQWIEGRKSIFIRLKKNIVPGEILWMHCSSLGEFEQGRPLLEKFKIPPAAGGTKFKILLTFFSPSGFEVTKNYDGADYIFYLPMDGASNAKQFFDIVKPQLILFIKYEFWFYYLSEAKKRNVPMLLVSGVFRKDQPFFKWYGQLHRQMLKSFHHFFLQNNASAELLSTLGITLNVSINGDTRFDRVLEIAANSLSFPAIEKFCSSADVVVAGSTWLEDDEELDHFANTNPHIKFIIAPHNIGKERIAECKKLYKHSVCYSKLDDTYDLQNINTLIIDNIGMLSQLYKYATVCYVGGAFGDDGVHNVLEAAVYSKPVVFGPEFEKYFEAGELVESGGGFSVENALELEKLLRQLLSKKDDYVKACNAAGGYVRSKKGSTDSILRYVQENRLLTS